MKEGEKWCYRGYYIANVSNPQPDSIYLNSSFGLACLEVEIETQLDLNTSVESHLKFADVRRDLFKSVLQEDFTIANRLLSERQKRVYMVRIEQYAPTDDDDDNQPSLF